MPTVRRHVVTIVVNGHALHEYEPPANDDQEVSEKERVVYIEAVEGQKFEIHVRSKGHLRFCTGSLGVFLYLDDECIVWKRISKHSYDEERGLTLTFKSIYQRVDESWMERPFQFNNLETTDTVTGSADLEQIARRTGTITVKIYNVSAPTRKSVPASARLVKKSLVPEKALKGQPIDMTTGFGEAKSTTKRWVEDDSGPIGDPLLKYVFKCRSRKALQMLELIPETPEPIPLHERDPNTLSLAEARELLSHIQEQAQRTGDMKREVNEMKEERDSDAALRASKLINRKRQASSNGQDRNDSDRDDDLIFVEAKKIKSSLTEEVEVWDVS